MAASTSPSGPMWAAGMGSRRGSDGGLEGGDGGVDEGVLVGGKVERGIKAGLAGASGRPAARQRHDGHWHVGLTLHRGQRRSLAARTSRRHLRSRHFQAGIRSFPLWPNRCPAASDIGYRHAGHRTRAWKSGDAVGAISAQAPP
jgi:hypothetical protein